MVAPLFQSSSQAFNIEPSGLMASSQGTVLHVFTPRRLQMMARRPLMTRFNEKFADEAANIITDTSLRIDDNFRKSSLDELINSSSAMNIVSPTAQVRGSIKTDYLSDYWTFLLVVNNEKPNYALMAPDGMADQASEFAGAFTGGNRAIYTGYFADEPVNLRTMQMTDITVNPNARMIITHKSLITANQGWGPGGTMRTRESVTADVDIVNPDLLDVISSSEPGSLHKNTPDALIGARERYTDDDGLTVTATHHGYSTELNKFGPSHITSSFAVPKNNLSTVVRGIKAQMESIEAESYKGTLSDKFDHLYDNSSDTLTSGLERRWRNANPMEHIGLQESEVITIKSCETRYGHVDVVPHPIAKDGVGDPVDQMVNSASNIYSSLFLQAAPTIMLNHRISDIMFIYDSYEDGYVPGTISYGLIGTTVSNVEEEKRVNAFLRSLRNDLYTVLYNGHGHFHLSASLTTSGVSKCTLNYYDDHGTITGQYELPNIAGGLVSNMIGDINEVSDNATNLAHLVDHITDTSHVNRNFGKYTNYADNPADDNMGGLMSDWEATGGRDMFTDDGDPRF